MFVLLYMLAVSCDSFGCSYGQPMQKEFTTQVECRDYRDSQVSTDPRNIIVTDCDLEKISKWN